MLNTSPTLCSSQMQQATKTHFVDIIIAIDIAYQRPGLPPHFDLFLETMNRILELSSRPDPNAAKGQGRKKKKGKMKEEPRPTNKETLFIYGHRRRMSISEDLLNLVYEHFEDVVPPIEAHQIDPKSFSSKEKHGITVSILKQKKDKPKTTTTNE